ncbi:MAG: peptide chain release factor 1, partial [Deltaproteobacteria bacterium]|nr:peptide chain release factor 1 [Deltaproteobacteria bacterium]
MMARLEEIEASYHKLEKALADPEVMADQARYRALAKDHSDQAGLVAAIVRLKQVQAEISSNRELLNDKDPEMRQLAAEEVELLKAEQEELTQKIKVLLLPKDPNDDKNVVLEIRAGTGGEEASLFAADLFRMYSRFAESKNWRVDLLSRHETGTGGVKEIIALIEGRGAYSQLKYESGVHRVQRVPVTESQGRIHTSAASVAVMPEAEEVDIEIDPAELRIDTYRSSGAGGQHVNVTDSAIRITHLPTGIVVSCQDERSQHKNKAKAMKVLRARLLDRAIEEQEAEISQTRRALVGSGDRSERIRTYNFPQGRLTDHRVGLTLYRLEEILAGDLDELIT